MRRWSRICPALSSRRGVPVVLSSSMTMESPSYLFRLHRLVLNGTMMIHSDTAPTKIEQGGTKLQLYNSLTGTVESLLPISDGDRCSPMTLQPTPTPPTIATTGADSTQPPAKGLAWYTCGPTTYAPAHLGHARTYVCLDILRRVMTAKDGLGSSSSGPQPLFVLNITDVDDKIIMAAAAAEKEEEEEKQKASTSIGERNDDDDVKNDISSSSSSSRDDGNHQRLRNSRGDRTIAFARRYEADFWRDWDDLNCLRPHIVTRVTEHVDSHIVPFIERLVDGGMAYTLSPRSGTSRTTGSDDGDDGDNVGGVYFDVRAYNDKLGLMGRMNRYGKLAPPAASQDIDIVANIMQGTKTGDEADVRDQQYLERAALNRKRDPRDFVLWKRRKVGETLYWDSPWGEGRPGWHIECSAMIQAVQEQVKDTHTFLVHAGGVDLKFPHHTNEIAQSEAYMLCDVNKSVVKEWIPHWVHTGHLHIDGLKMSKSLKNFVSIRDFLNGTHNRQRSNQDERDGVDTRDPTVRKSSSVLESSSDDFRLWCLGRSGSYRGQATFSSDRIDEARTIRQKILCFLMDGEAWMRRQEPHAGNSYQSQQQQQQQQQLENQKVWRSDEYDLFRKADEARRRGLIALERDLDGSAFLDEVLVIVNLGMHYIGRTDRGPVEPLMAVIGDLRSLLRLVGFTKTTTEAGIRPMNDDDAAVKEGSVVIGGETAITDALARFRSEVRAIALEAKASVEGGAPLSEGMKRILLLSDEMRDNILPEIGIQLVDVDQRDGITSDSWKFCLPKPRTTKPKEDMLADAGGKIDLFTIPLTDFFKVGQYEGSFARFNEDGIPMHNADGSKVSKRLLKKLLKKREVHEQRLRSVSR